MKQLIRVVATILFSALPATGQVPSSAPAAPSPSSPERLESLLEALQKRMCSLDSLSTRLTRTDVDPLTKKTKTFVGEIAFMKPDLGRIDLTDEGDVGKKDGEKARFERILWNGERIYVYKAEDKEIVVLDTHKNDAKQNAVPARRMGFIGNWLASLSDKIQEAFVASNPAILTPRFFKDINAKNRFDVTLTKETEWYAYLLIAPKNSEKEWEFTRLQLTIWLKNPNSEEEPDLTMMPCRIWYRQPNGNEITYLFSDTRPNAKIDRKSLAPLNTEGYKIIDTTPRLDPKPDPSKSPASP